MRHKWKRVEKDLRKSWEEARPLIDRCVRCGRWRLTYVQHLKTYYKEDHNRAVYLSAGECPGERSERADSVEDSRGPSHG